MTMLDDASVTATFKKNPKAGISAVTVSGPGKIKRGRTYTYRVRVKNSGNAPARGVRLIVSGRRLRFNAPVRVINPGVTRRINVRIRPSRPGRVRFIFRVKSANAGGKVVKRTITVRR